jgi:eukaryotic-like serine/threonine-protein kinase
MLTGGCLDENAVVAFLAGRTPPDERASVEHHLHACTSCSELVTWVAADLAHRSRTPGQEGRPFVGSLAPGARVDRYQILNAVGRGGMGEVYAAYHPDLDRRVALKVVHEWGADSAERRARLLREARAIARLSHPNVIAVHDAGTFDHRVYIAMEFVEGQTVDAWLGAQRRTWREVLDVFIAAARGLAAAHAAGLVHRDFKPQNAMIGRDGTVRVMDFGLAVLADEAAENVGYQTGAHFRPEAATITKTGALVGTLAYMAPEQFRGEEIDARADQFSFCVALYEALYAVRPALAHVDARLKDGVSGVPRTANTPTWLKAVLSRGLAEKREQRFPSMDRLIRALLNGRTAPRRRALGAGAAVTIMLLALGGWRVARGNRISCGVPIARLAAAWSGHDDARRTAVHLAFQASRRPNAETSWQRAAQLLDDYVSRWSAMYVETCEATQLRGEQSTDVLDLRMACLAANLDEVRALTEAFLHADATAVSRAATATSSLTPVSHCGDVAVLRSAVPLPRDPATLRAVQEMKSALRGLRAREDVGDRGAASSMAEELQPQVEAIGYKPLFAELLELEAVGKVEQDPAAAEKLAEQAFLVAEASGDEVTAVRTASHLIYIVGYGLNRRPDAARWARIAYALLDKLGSGQGRLRAWVMADEAAVLTQEGEYERAQKLIEESVRLKVEALGEQHWDVGISLINLSCLLNIVGDSRGALVAADRAEAILNAVGDPDNYQVADLKTNRATALTALGQYEEAERDFISAFRIHPREKSGISMELGDQLHGYGSLRLAQGRSGDAIPMLEEALEIRKRTNADATFTADTRFALARALWDGGKERPRAVTLAASARQTYAKHDRGREIAAVARWLASHRPVRAYN